MWKNMVAASSFLKIAEGGRGWGGKGEGQEGKKPLVNDRILGFNVKGPPSGMLTPATISG